MKLDTETSVVIGRYVMKRRTKKILIIVGAVYIVHILPIIYIIFFHNGTPDQLRRDIIQYEDAYTAVAELYYADYKSYDEERIRYYQPHRPEGIHCSYHEAVRGIR